ncbi:hypothetical protein BGZ63DRAFT_420385 [Mariannaea sp. PMI_226]|nr:hypothetical protein BGZ63DRAFT_420385 [Mariannaea sp. PMI_226]
MDFLSFGIDLSRNYSYYTVPVVFFITAVPHAYGVLSSKMHYDNANPRKHTESVAKSEVLDKLTAQRVERAKAASINGFETLGFYAAAVTAANVTGVPAESLNLLTFGYVVSRVLYNFAYIWLCTNRRAARIRTATWITGISLTMALWIKAANRTLAN